MTGLFDVKVLEKILFNFLNNAFKYTNGGGEILFEILFDMEREKPPYKTGFQLLNEKVRARKYIYFRVADSWIDIIQLHEFSTGTSPNYILNTAF